MWSFALGREVVDSLVSKLSREPFPRVYLGSTGLLVLADLTSISQRTVLTGGADYFDALTICPGIHGQSQANRLNEGEYPACAALTSGYVFRIENPATVNFLQRSGNPGVLTTIKVSQNTSYVNSLVSRLLVFITQLMTILSLALLFMLHDLWSLTVLLSFMVCRAMNVFVVRQRVFRGSQWKGAREPGAVADLLVLASQDRWFRIQGSVDDVKAVTSGQWFSDATFSEGCTISVAKVILFLSVALTTNCSQIGSIILIALLLLSAASLAIANYCTESLTMHGLSLVVSGTPKAYMRRRDLADELIKSTGRRDWAVALGMVPPQKGEAISEVVILVGTIEERFSC